MARGSSSASLIVEHREATDRWPALELRLSARRRRTATASFDGDRLILALPARMSRREREETVTWLVERALSRRRKLPNSDEALLTLAMSLSERYLDGRAPNSLVWSQRQEKRFGSCSTDTGAIRISSRLREVPAWVLEAVLIHELAHLSHPNHSAEFSALANRYPRQDEARLWLEGFEAGYQRSQEDNRD